MERLGRYELLEEVGRGGMGVVYKARDPAIERLVALKMLLPAEGMDPVQAQQHRDRFLREARAAGRLAHPNIVTVHDVGEDQGRAFLVMEFIEGQTLEQLLRTRSALGLDQVLMVGDQVCQALDYAHRNGVIHRDIKPANILLTREGIAKVTDLGIARVTGATLTQTGRIVGTPSYMSPEQVAGLKVDGRSDIFSLAAVMYELLSGEKAFPGDTITTVMYRILHEDPIPLRRLNPAFPPSLDACLKKALAKDPARRYAQATDLARDLRAGAEGKPSSVEAPTAATLPRVPRVAPPRVQPLPRHRTPRWLWLGAGGVAVAGLGLALALWLRPFEKPGTPPSTPATPQAPAADEEAAKQRAAETEAQRKAEEDRLAAERKRLEEEKARLAEQQAALEAERTRAAEELARRKAAAEESARRKKEAEQGILARESARTASGVLNRIQFSGNTVITAQELEGLVRDRLGRPATTEELQTIADRVTEYYTSRGYVLARAYSHLQDPRSGILGIEVLEGRAGGLRVDGFLPREGRIVERAFAPVIQRGVVERDTLKAAIRVLAERHSLIVGVRIEPAGPPGTFDFVVQRSRSGQVEFELPGESRPRLFPLKSR